MNCTVILVPRKRVLKTGIHALEMMTGDWDVIDRLVEFSETDGWDVYLTMVQDYSGLNQWVTDNLEVIPLRWWERKFMLTRIQLTWQTMYPIDEEGVAL